MTHAEAVNLVVDLLAKKQATTEDYIRVLDGDVAHAERLAASLG